MLVHANLPNRNEASALPRDRIQRILLESLLIYSQREAQGKPHETVLETKSEDTTIEPSPQIKPKGPRTPYNLFFRDMRTRLSKLPFYQANKSAINVGSLISQCWRNKTPLMRLRYDQMSANDKFRYYNEKAEYDAYREESYIKKDIKNDTPKSISMQREFESPTNIGLEGKSTNGTGASEESVGGEQKQEPNSDKGALEFCTERGNEMVDLNDRYHHCSSPIDVSFHQSTDVTQPLYEVKKHYPPNHTSRMQYWNTSKDRRAPMNLPPARDNCDSLVVFEQLAEDCYFHTCGAASPEIKLYQGEIDSPLVAPRAISLLTTQLDAKSIDLLIKAFK